MIRKAVKTSAVFLFFCLFVCLLERQQAKQLSQSIVDFSRIIIAELFFDTNSNQLIVRWSFFFLVRMSRTSQSPAQMVCHSKKNEKEINEGLVKSNVFNTIQKFIDNFLSVVSAAAAAASVLWFKLSAGKRHLLFCGSLAWERTLNSFNGLEKRFYCMFHPIIIIKFAKVSMAHAIVLPSIQYTHYTWMDSLWTHT